MTNHGVRKEPTRYLGRLLLVERERAEECSNSSLPVSKNVRVHSGLQHEGSFLALILPVKAHLFRNVAQVTCYDEGEPQTLSLLFLDSLSRAFSRNILLRCGGCDRMKPPLDHPQAEYVQLLVDGKRYGYR